MWMFLMWLFLFVLVLRSGHDQLSARSDSYDDSDEPVVEPGLFEWD